MLIRQLRRLMPGLAARDMRLLFDAAFYRQQVPEIESEGEAFRHYMSEGWAAGLKPQAFFDTEFYLRRNPDIEESGIHPFYHFVKYGWREQRNPSKDFHIADYLQQNPDVARAEINPLLHYVRAGLSEGRMAPRAEEYDRQMNREYRTAQATSPLVGSATKSLGSLNVPDVKPAVDALAHGPKVELDIDYRRSLFVEAIAAAGIEQAGHVTPDLLGRAKEVITEHGRPTISVVIPTWNREATVCSAIRSAFAQMLTPDEVIVVDDGSVDGTIRVLRDSFGAEIASGRLKIFSEKHVGVSHARNVGLREAAGELIAYLDSDNLWRPSYLLIMAAVFRENPIIDSAYAALKSINRTSGEEQFRANHYDRKRLLTGNFIDLNVFMHRRRLYDRLGGFDEELTRLVDWDLIVTYTAVSEPAYVPFCGVDYYLDKEGLKNISFTENLDGNYRRVARKNRQERIRLGVESLRLAYFIYDFPALSQTFVMGELRWLVRNGVDVRVYHCIDPDRPCSLDFPLDIFRVEDAEQFAELLVEHDRNFIHGHFAYPGTTLFVEPASALAEVPYTFMAHAVDIFHHNNRERSKVDVITNSGYCLGAFVHGDYHRDFMVERGADLAKIKYVFQAVDPIVMRPFSPIRKEPRAVGVFIGRLIQKKGFEELVEAAIDLKSEDVEFHIYGYGPLQSYAEDKIASYGLDNIILKGTFEGQKDLQRVLYDADFLIAPCREAENGDLDGFPTVILEAMAAGVPVITTAVSSIPTYLRDGVEGIILPHCTPSAIAESVKLLSEMPESSLRAMVDHARKFVDRRIGTDKTMSRLLDTWCGYTLDIILVTHDTPQYDDRRSTFEVLERLLNHTQSCINLCIVDNGSSEDFRRELVDFTAGRKDCRLVFLAENIFCGPASNLALTLGQSELATYVCSKEGFVAQHAWDRELIEEMRRSREVDLAGYETHLPRYAYMGELTEHPDFKRFRNQHFAHVHLDEPFKHIQGGVFIIRRSSVAKFGGFSEELPQNNMDVEYSYYLQSVGAKLGNLESIRSISIKTRPDLTTVVDEDVAITHPLSADNVTAIVDSTRRRDIWHCNLCGTTEPITEAVRRACYSDEGVICESCGGTPFGRSVARFLAHDHRTHRGLSIGFVSSDPSLGQFLQNRLFAEVTHFTSVQSILQSDEQYDVLCIDWDAGNSEALSKIMDRLAIARDPLLMLSAADAIDPNELRPVGLNIQTRQKPSRYLMLDPRPFIFAAKYHRLHSENAYHVA